MKFQQRHFFVIIFLGCCLMLWGCESTSAVQDAQPADTPVSVSGKPAADFSLQNLSGETVSLSGLKGKKVLLDFWATWCPPCRSELPDMNNVANDLTAQGVVVLNISVDSDIETVKKFIARYGYNNLTVLFDDKKIAVAYGVSAIPTKVLIDENGNIANQRVGALSEKELKNFLGLN